MRTRTLSFPLLFVVVCGALALAACDSALEEDPTSFVSPDNFYNNAEDARAALNGAYRGLSVQGDYMIGYVYLQVLELPGPTLNGSEQPATLLNGDGRMHNWRWTPDTGKLTGPYNLAYRGINWANAAINNVPGIENMDPQLRARFVAEASFIRAYHYFNLVRLFGGIPLVRNETTSPLNLQRPRTPEDSVYTFLINDLEPAIEALPLKSEYSGNAVVRVSKGAAQMLLAKVYLRRGALSAANGITGERQLAQPGDYQAALDLINEVITSGEYALPDDVQAQFRDMFIDPPQGQNEEVIFAIQRSPSVTPQDFLPCRMWPTGATVTDATWTNFASELPFYNSFENADLRKEVSFITEYESNEAGNPTVVYDQNNIEGDGYSKPTPTIKKYSLQPEEGNFCYDDNNYVLLRYADLLLMKAEAISEMNQQGPNGEAYDAINQVRERAGLDPLSGLDYQGFREALYEERNKELLFEHKSWFDVQRFFDMATKMVQRNAEINDSLNEQLPGPQYNFGPLDPQIDDPTDRLFPIPQIALDRNSKLTQNPGY